MVKFKKTAFSVVSVGLAACFSTSIAAMAIANTKTGKTSVEKGPITRIDAPVDNRTADYFDDNVVYRLSDNVKSNEEISVILSLDTESVLDAYLESGSKDEFSDYLSTSAAKNLKKQNNAARDALRKSLDKAKISYKMGVGYDTIINGFEILLKAKDYYKLAGAVGEKASLIVGEVYAPAETEIVTNEVDVYDTGIFDSSSCEFQGDGVVVAVLDTGLDYTHTAFSVENFTTNNERFTLGSISDLMKETSLDAATTTANLKAEDVYVNKKVPYAYDYADKDTDVFPLDSEHGTHVAGVIAGKDDVITGVAPNAQLAIMKVFSDSQQGARTSWMIAALEDCVNLGVDVINMSLGSGAGFTTQDDEKRIEDIYDKVRDAGISLVTAAGNDNNAVTGSDKNGSNPLTSNPDSGIVGSPSTYKAALSVASVGGVKTPYFVYNDEIMYFTEAVTSSAKPKNFVDDVLKTVGADSYDFEYVTIPGVGRRSDYSESRDFYKNKIVLVKRGDTTFEEKVDIALRIMGASGIIIYNNVSGSISMSVGADIGAVCSISQDEGEKLAAAKTGILKISKSQTAGPFMSDFSSWGPTSDLRIKPEITAHGGEIYSAVPGQSYDRLSGTSMACPNMAGAAALIRQTVKDNPDKYGVNDASGALDPILVTNRVNQLAMSTADIVRNKNGLAYAVRKQGAGLVNIGKATTSAAYISTFETDEDGRIVEMDKSKLELGDDKNRTGVYTMTFAINNVSDSSVSYEIGSIVMTEGVSPTYTSHGDTTVTTDGYLLNPTTTIENVDNGTKNGTVVSVGAGSSATVTVKIELSEEDKNYLNDSFQYGMYVEGFITMKATSGTSVDMSVPYLAFYGDWTEAPIFDEEYYDTNPDELNAGIDPEDKIMADAYATRVFGEYYNDYITTLGTYPFIQNPNATQIAANKEHIALSNYEDGPSSALNKINSIAAGLLRNVKYWRLSVVEDSTGEEIWHTDDRNQRKSSSSGITIYQSSMEVDFSVLEHNLKNNTKYTVTVTAYIDYGNYEDQNNVKNTFSFPLYIDFEAPVVTGVEYRTEYDYSTKKTRLFADVNIYDNHYAMAVQFGQIVEAAPGSEYKFTMNSFGKYVTPVFSSYNSTSKVSIELTDYVNQIKNFSAGVKYDPETGTSVAVDNNNSFIATCYDYAMNVATYELRLPDEVLAMYFKEKTVRLNPNETLDLTTILDVYPSNTWLQLIDFESADDDFVSIVNHTAIAKEMGIGNGWGTDVSVTAIYEADDGTKITAATTIHVIGNQETDYRKYDPPQVNKATIAQYKTIKAFYSIDNEDRGVGVTGGTYDFGNDHTLSMYPSESVQLICSIDSYFPDYTTKYTTTRPEAVTVTEDGTITALAKGSATVNVNVEVKYSDFTTISFYVGMVDITVKDPYTTNSLYLSSYKGLGGEVKIPGDRGITTIQSYAFSNYEYVEKDLDAGDVIDDEDPYHVKQMYIGEDTIEKVIIPEGVTIIEAYAFAKLTKLKEVVLPSSLIRIGVGAFYGCNKLEKVNFENVQFINKSAFEDCAIQTVNFDKIVAIGSRAFANNKIEHLSLPVSAQSLDSGAFYENTSLKSVTFDAPQIKIGSEVFKNCTNLKSIEINATVIPAGAFYGCLNLENVTLGKDVAVIGEEAFGSTAVASFKLAAGNKNLELKDGGKLIYKSGSGELVMVAPQYGNTTLNLDGIGNTTSVASGAFAGNSSIQHVIGNNIEIIESYAFADCINLIDFVFPKLKEIGDFAFYNASRLTLNSSATDESNNQLAGVTKIGEQAFAHTTIREVSIANGTKVGEMAFAYCNSLEKITIGNGATIGEAAFFTELRENTFLKTPTVQNLINNYEEYTHKVGEESYTYYRYKFDEAVLSSLTALTLGEGVTVGDYAFANCGKLNTLTLNGGTKIGAYAFHNATKLETVDFTKVVELGEGAFSGSREQEIWHYRGDYRPAYEFKEVTTDGKTEYIATGYRYTDFAAPITEVNLTSIKGLNALGKSVLGDGAFAFNSKLTTVILPSDPGYTKIGDYMFAQCVSLTSVKVDGSTENALPAAITEIGDYAFLNTQVTFDLDNVKEIGQYAFDGASLTSVKFGEGAKIGAYAFYNCEQLAAANLGTVAEIGEWAFAYTALEDVDLSGASVIGDFAFGSSKVKTIKLGSNLNSLGENPFYGCAISDLSKTVKEEVFPGLTVEKKLTTYDVNDTVKVIDNVIYKVVPNKGLVLVTYPIGLKNGNYTVEEGTVRIGARAFQGAGISNVTLPRSLKAIGDKAFYECNKLTTVIFKSIDAPILEEEFDPYYMTADNLPISSSGYEGLGISDYYMWNASSPNNFYYGANFVNNIGKFSPNLVMVRPANGTGYETFILEKYFNNFVLGSNVATDDTLNVIAMIEALSSSISLKDEAAVAAARYAYESLPNLDQKALVTNYSKLTSAENTIAYLKQNNTQPTPTEPEAESGSVNALGIAGFTIAGVLLLALAALTAYMLLEKRKARVAARDDSENTETVNEESAEDTAEEKAEEKAEESSEKTEPDEASSESENNDNE